VNRAPIAQDDAQSGDEDGQIFGNVLVNDLDPDGDTINATLSAGPSNGNLLFNADGSFIYTPNADFNGMDSFDYIANDGSLSSNAATVTLTVSPVNDAPVFLSQGIFEVAENSTAVTTLSATDVDGDDLTYSIVGGDDAAFFELGSGGTLSFKSAPDFENPADMNIDNSYEVSVAVSDGIEATERLIRVDIVNVFEVIAPGEGETIFAGAADSYDLGSSGSALEGDLTVLDGVVIENFSVDNTIVVTGESLRASNITVSQGPAILNIDADGDGISEAEIVLEGDFLGARFLLEQTDAGTNITLDPNLTQAADQRGATIRGSSADEEIRMTDHRTTVAFGGEGADFFVFGEETRNGTVNRYQIKDYDPLEDVFLLEEGVTVGEIEVSKSGRFATMQVGADNDFIKVFGEDLTLDSFIFLERDPGYEIA
jgi:hypothetical protein